jgi:hypothetical protein
MPVVSATAAVGTEDLFCLEFDMRPHMTEPSLAPDFMARAGRPGDELARWMDQDASLKR